LARRSRHNQGVYRDRHGTDSYVTAFAATSSHAAWREYGVSARA